MLYVGMCVCMFLCMYVMYLDENMNENQKTFPPPPLPHLLALCEGGVAGVEEGPAL